ncbi:HIT family protein [Candidatus Kaiserbacteria bacterium]|nr:HIT family protein [Candidatus Kaiserbacteria bacterium]
MEEPDQASCIFCKIAKGEIPSTKVYEDDRTLAFLDIRPVNPGHTLIIPKAHYRNILDIPEEAFLDVARTIKKVAPAVKAGSGAEGVNVSSSHEPSAGQEVFHLHFHIIPRFGGDGLKHWPKSSYAEGEATAAAEKIKKALS